MNFIEELYYGNINPNEKRHNLSTEYTQAMKTFSDNEERLSKTLSGKRLKWFLNLVNASDEISAVSSEESFKIGFRLGVQMMCDSLVFDGNIQYLEIMNNGGL